MSVELTVILDYYDIGSFDPVHSFTFVRQDPVLFEKLKKQAKPITPKQFVTDPHNILGFADHVPNKVLTRDHYDNELKYLTIEEFRKIFRIRNASVRDKATLAYLKELPEYVKLVLYFR